MLSSSRSGSSPTSMGSFPINSATNATNTSNASRELRHVVNDDLFKQPLLEMLDSQSCCPASCQRCLCGSCVKFFTPWRTCFTFVFGVVAIATVILILKQYGILWPAAVDTPPPTIPGGPYLRSATPMSLSVTWLPSDGHGVSISSYHLSYKPNNIGVPWIELNAGTSLYMNISALSPMTQYAVRVIAFTKARPSNWSDSAIFTTQNGSIPSVPGQAIVNAVSSIGLALVWQPSSEFGVPVLAYELQLRNVTNTYLDDDEAWMDAYYGTDTSFTVSPLEPDSEYEFRLRAIAVNDEGNTSWSSVSRFHTDANDATAPLNSSMLLTSVNSHSAIVWWNRPPDGGSEILTYTIEHDSGSGTPFGHQVTFPIAPPFDRVTQFIDQLSHSTSYQFHFRAFNHFGDGLWSETIIVKTTELVPPDPPSSLTVTAVDEKTQTVQWKPGKSYGADILGYQLEKDDWWTDSGFKPFPETLELVQPVTGLLPAVTYNYRLRERNKAGWSTYINLTASTLTYGACGNPSDMQRYKSKRNEWSAIVKSCMTQCIPYPAEVKCTRGCVVKNLGLSVDCGGCYQDEDQCIKQYCIIQCAIGKPLFDCSKCVQDFCYPSLLRCTGIPASILPP